jgi:hypothetical protein
MGGLATRTRESR